MVDQTGSLLLYQRLKSLSQTDAAKEIREMLGQSETSELDFTCKKDPSRAELHSDDQRGFAKAVSGFANSQGGLLIWGVEAKRKGHDPEEPDVATALQPICNVDAFASALNHLLPNATTPVAGGAENTPILEKSGARKGYCVTWIPEGISPPYRTNLSGCHLYYKRASNSFYEMEPYDVRDVIFRFRYPKLRIHVSRGLQGRAPNTASLEVLLENMGPVSLRAFKFILELPKGLVAVFHGVREIPGWDKPRNGVPYEACVVKSVVGCSEHTRPPAATYYIREPIYPEEPVHLLGGNTGRDITYNTSWPDIGYDIPMMQLYWTLYGDDMPSVHGDCRIFDLVSGL